MSFRKEKKFRITLSDWNILSQKLTLDGMKQLYADRVVSSTYFDNIKQEMFWDSEEGLLPRKKVRVRWYDGGKKFHHEIKISSIEGRYKTTKLLTDIATSEEISSLKLLDAQYGALRPSLVVTYRRSYFSYQELRVTFDQNISYLLDNASFKNIIHDQECVVEIKTPYNCGDDFIESCLSNPTEKFSKYCRGLLSHNLGSRI